MPQTPENSRSLRDLDMLPCNTPSRLPESSESQFPSRTNFEIYPLSTTTPTMAFDDILPTMFEFQTPQASSARKRKSSRQYMADENLPPENSLPPSRKKARKNVPLVPLLSPHTPMSGQRRPRRDDQTKLTNILATIMEQGWAFSDFMYHVFRLKDENGNPCSRTQQHANMVNPFLAGRTTHRPAHIIDYWMSNKDGRIPRDSPDSNLLYSTTTPYVDIRPVRAALTSFAVQIIAKKLSREAESAVKSANGLHVSISSKTPTNQLAWGDIGPNTVPRVTDIIRTHQPVAWHLANTVAARKVRFREGGYLPTRKTRPAEVVSVLVLLARTL